ncbi:MAG: radical SAM protein, partial [Chloracidobacterium sp.]
DMAAAGCIGVIMGIESMDPETLKDYNKTATSDDNAQCIRLLKKHGIASMASIIIGHPKETRESLQATMKYMCDLNPEMLWINILTPYVGTTMRREFIQSGRLLPNLSWEDYDISHVTFKLDHLQAWEIEVTRKAMTAMYYTRPKYLLENLPRLFFGKTPTPVVKQAAC